MVAASIMVSEKGWETSLEGGKTAPSHKKHPPSTKNKKKKTPPTTQKKKQKKKKKTPPRKKPFLKSRDIRGTPRFGGGKGEEENEGFNPEGRERGNSLLKINKMGFLSAPKREKSEAAPFS